MANARRRDAPTGRSVAEALGLTWTDVRAAAAELHINWQLQRVSHNLLHSEAKTEESTAVVPLPEICRAALKIHREQQDQARVEAAGAWHDLGWSSPHAGEPRSSPQFQP